MTWDEKLGVPTMIKIKSIYDSQTADKYEIELPYENISKGEMLQKISAFRRHLRTLFGSVPSEFVIFRLHSNNQSLLDDVNLLK